MTLNPRATWLLRVLLVLIPMLALLPFGRLVADWVASLDAAAVEQRCVENDVPVGLAYDAADIVAKARAALGYDIVRNAVSRDAARHRGRS